MKNNVQLENALTIGNGCLAFLLEHQITVLLHCLIRAGFVKDHMCLQLDKKKEKLSFLTADVMHKKMLLQTLQILLPFSFDLSKLSNFGGKLAD